MNTVIRQGDVSLIMVLNLPDGCELIKDQDRKIILAWGEVTGHHHRIEDHVLPAAADEIAEAAIARAKAKARLWVAGNGMRYLEVQETVTLTHEEHSAAKIEPGIYKLPTQVEYSPAELLRVAD